MVWTYKAMVQPIMLYAASVWASRLDTKTAAGLKRLNRLALMGLGPMRKSTPTAGLEIILDVPPWI